MVTTLVLKILLKVENWVIILDASALDESVLHDGFLKIDN